MTVDTLCHVVRNATVAGARVDIAIISGRIVEIGPALVGETLFDAKGAAVIPGLHDHHIHLLATAALTQSVQLDDCVDADDLARRLRDADAELAPGLWLRATGYHERIAGPVDRWALDRIVANRPVRMQHQTGSLWMLNSAGLAALDAAVDGAPWPAGAELTGPGESTGRFFRSDGWLSDRIGRTVPDLTALGRALAACGVTSVTDASVSNDASSATLLATAVRDGRLPLDLTLMSGGPLDAVADGAYAVGPVKIMLDDANLPAIDNVTAMIARARGAGRRVAAHCVTAGELALFLAALEEAGAQAGDRIEHGSVIPEAAFATIRALALTVVTQPAFIATRGDRYLELVDPAEHDDLYRFASLIASGIGVGGSSDAPYGDPDPWRAIRAAATRQTDGGHLLGKAERVSAQVALNAYLTPADDPGGAPRQVCVGARANLCVLGVSLATALANPDASHVAATIAGGRISYRAA